MIDAETRRFIEQSFKEYDIKTQEKIKALEDKIKALEQSSSTP